MDQHPQTNIWTWISGGTGLYIPGSFGTIGTAAPGNYPGARGSAVSWTDPSGNLWLFGGYTYTSFLQPFDHPLNDVWKFDPVTTLWTCFNGNSSIKRDTFVVKGMESPVTSPALRRGAAGWTDASGNLWVFGGAYIERAADRYNMNDLLKYNPKTNLWSLKHDINDGRQYGVYGIKGMPGTANKPGARYGAASTTDSAGNLWLLVDTDIKARKNSPIFSMIYGSGILLTDGPG